MRQDTYRSPDYKSKYAKLLEDYSESSAINESLKDQMKLLEKENRQLKRKVEAKSTAHREDDTRQSPRSSGQSYYPKTDQVSLPAPDHNIKAVDSETSQLLARYQTDTRPRYQASAEPRHREKANKGNFDSSWTTKSGSTTLSGHRPRISGTELYNGNSSFSRFALDSYQTTTHEHGANTRRRRLSSDMSDVSADLDISRYLHARSYSSDSLVPASLLHDGSSGSSRNPSKTQQSPSQDVAVNYRKQEKKRRDRPHSYHSGFVTKYFIFM